MCKSGAQCGCGGGSSARTVIVVGAALLIAAGLDGASLVLADVIVAALVTVTLLAVAGITTFVVLLRRGNAALSAPSPRPAIPPVQSRRLPASTQHAISTARRDAAITGITIHHHPEGLRK